jgi:putative addiction module CopG family antidote
MAGDPRRVSDYGMASIAAMKDDVTSTMSSTNISLPQSLMEFVQRRVEQGGHASASEYIHELIRRDQRTTARAPLETELLCGIASRPATQMTKRSWSRIREEVARRIARSKQR